jgi:hypothetical protein
MDGHSTIFEKIEAWTKERPNIKRVICLAVGNNNGKFIHQELTKGNPVLFKN